MDQLEHLTSGPSGHLNIIGCDEVDNNYRSNIDTDRNESWDEHPVAIKSPHGIWTFQSMHQVDKQRHNDWLKERGTY